MKALALALAAAPLGLILQLPAAAQAQSLTRRAPVLTHAGAQAVLAAAEKLAAKAGDPAALAVVDADGVLLAFDRMDGVRPGSGELAIGKARTAALMQRPTEEIEANVVGGRIGLATAGLVALRGGAPLVVSGAFVGAVGVAGVRKEDDAQDAAGAAASLAAAP